MEQQGWVKFFKQMKDFKVNKGNKQKEPLTVGQHIRMTGNLYKIPGAEINSNA